MQELMKRQREQHRQAITGHDNQIQAIQHENVAMQAQIDVYLAQLQRCQDQICDHMINRHVPRANDPGKDTLLRLLRKTPHGKMISTSIPTILREYNYGLLAQKNDALGHNSRIRLIIEELDNAVSIHAFNRFKEEGHVEHFQYHFRVFDLARDALYMPYPLLPFTTDHN